MVNHDTYLVPGFTVNILVPTPANVAVLQGPLGPLPVGRPHSLYQVSSQQGNLLSPCGPRTPQTSLSAPGDSSFPPEHCQLLSCGVQVSDSALPLFIILTVFKPSSFSFPPFVLSLLMGVSTFLSLQLLWGGGGVLFLYSPPISVLSPQKQLSTLSFSLPRFTNPCCVPAEFCGSGYEDCCVNPQISFLGVQDGLVLI